MPWERASYTANLPECGETGTNDCCNMIFHRSVTFNVNTQIPDDADRGDGRVIYPGSGSQTPGSKSIKANALTNSAT